MTVWMCRGQCWRRVGRGALVDVNGGVTSPTHGGVQAIWIYGRPSASVTVELKQVVVYFPLEVRLHSRIL